MKKSILIVVVCAAFGLQAFAQEAAKVSNNLATNATDARQQSFDIVWRTVKEKHFDPTFGGVIVGERSAGAVLPWDMIKLPTGAIFQYAFADFRTPSGALIEGRGVAPDVDVKHTRASLLAGRDSPLEAAIVELQKRPRRE
jgi:Peptidase family S41